MARKKNNKSHNTKGALKKQPQSFSGKKPATTVVNSKLSAWYIALFLIIAASFIAYLPVLHNGFVWDDEFYILQDKLIQTINFKELFTQFVIGNYHPLTMLTYAIEYHFWGVAERGYHIVNILFHLFNTLLVFYVVFLLSEKRIVALVACLLFGIHPIHVESVAWVAERKDLLYTFFFLLSYVCYLNYLKDHTKKLYFYCLLLFLFSLLSKAMAASLPVVLILTDYFKEGKISKTAWLEKIPFLVLSLIFGIVAVFAQRSHGAVPGIESFAVLPRIVFACSSFITYLYKLFIPVNLSVYYPYPVKGGNIVPLLYYIYPVLFPGLVALVLYSLRFSRKVLFGTGFFAITVFLVLQLLQVGDAIMADRYEYIPSIGIFYLAGEGFYFLWNGKGLAGRLRIPALVTLFIISGFLFAATYTRCTVWKDGMSLWNDVISKFQTIPVAYNSRGKLLLEQKNYEAALSDFNKTIELDSNYPLVYNNRATLLMDLGRYEESEKDFNVAIALVPQPNAYNNRGVLLMKEKKYDESLKDYDKAIELNPDFSEAYFNRGTVFEIEKKYPEALNDYNKAISLNPGNVLIYNNRANVFYNEKKYDEALNDYNKAIELDPNPRNAYLNRGNLFLLQKKYNEAISDYDKTIELDPNFDQAYYIRGIAENEIGKKDAACADFKQALALKYEPAETAYNLYCH